MQVIVTVIISVGIALAAYGLAYWAYRARSDRSATVGLYLLFGIPGGLLSISGLALLVGENRIGGLFLLLGLGLGLPLLKPVRRLFAAVTPMDAASPVDMTGLAIILGMLGLLVFSSLVSRDPPDEIVTVDLVDLLLQAVLLVVLAYAAVGTGIVRTVSVATARLGITRPSWRAAGAAIGFLVLAYLAQIAVGAVGMVVQPEVFEELEAVTDEMTADVQNPIGAMILGICAGAGEEAAFRGALQPRFGIPLTSIVFALLHAPQYGASIAIVGLFAVSVLLGLERRYFGTTAAMATHALYNFGAVMLQSTL
ncbi:MAG: CPBP family intramembrane metalloprotease [Chloroflexota bacterium]|nr:CPBP family intramembrane metalloprotease [Chloroflexota bacterium]